MFGSMCNAYILEVCCKKGVAGALLGQRTGHDGYEVVAPEISSDSISVLMSCSVLRVAYDVAKRSMAASLEPACEGDIQMEDDSG
jgi:hypothetical protein